MNINNRHDMQGQLIKGMLNTKFKTTMCRAYEQNETCTMGERCHFAHGREELRRIKDVSTFY